MTTARMTRRLHLRAERTIESASSLDIEMRSARLHLVVRGEGA